LFWKLVKVVSFSAASSLSFGDSGNGMQAFLSNIEKDENG